MSGRIRELASHTAYRTQKTRWPLEGLCSAPTRRRRCGASGTAAPSPATRWTPRCGCAWTATRCAGPRRLARAPGRGVRGAPSSCASPPQGPGRAHLDPVWTGLGVSTETVRSLGDRALRIGAETSALTVRDVDGQWRRVLVLSVSARRGVLPLPAPAGEQPEHAALDAALVQHGRAGRSTTTSTFARSSAQAEEMADWRLADPRLHRVRHRDHGIRCPRPATRSSRSARRASSATKLRRQKPFEQLVDPQRTVPEAGIPIHGITPAMVEASRRFARCCRRSTPSRRTPCQSRTTRRSTCASCS